jgi:hypothetical protein
MVSVPWSCANIESQIDLEFRRRANQTARLGALDVFRVSLKTTTTTLRSGRVKHGYSILKVLGH